MSAHHGFAVAWAAPRDLTIALAEPCGARPVLSCSRSCKERSSAKRGVAGAVGQRGQAAGIGAGAVGRRAELYGGGPMLSVNSKSNGTRMFGG